ncbi:MAG: biotin--[acetyl-CoA-carboxylase] ligase [Flavobacteriaceae bacterium]|nr:biotin--[acetyl-CoA-carboxylase] ligase [Flavobacteriaceae bacterium]
MKIIKLDAIDSTNSFLKELAQNSSLENYTIVTTKEQKKGRGQMGTQWVSEPNKNLLCSVYVAFDKFPVADKVFLNYAVSLAVIYALEKFNVPKLAIKWPNDILSSNQKICGVLVENVMQSMEIKSAIIGIGINVNQEVFPNHLKNVTSIKNEVKRDIDLDELLHSFVDELKRAIAFITNSTPHVLEKNYLELLYKKNIPTMFRNSNDVLFMGKIVGVSLQGKLQIEFEDESIQEFGIKEVSFA